MAIDLNFALAEIRSNLSNNYVEENSGFKTKVMVNDYQGIQAASTVIATQVVQNADDIAQNVTDIAQNATDIAQNAQNLTDHEADNSAHGVTGVVVGTENFCTDVLGGVVLLMELVNDAVASTAVVTITDVSAAPLSYNQAYGQEQTDMINDIKAKHNQLLIDMNLVVAQLNDMIAKSKTAKQMAI